MIISKLIKLKVGFEDIEKEFSRLGIDPIRWAVVKIEEKILTISVAHDIM